jgi:glycosyltransferase involved in cell wall biosynthesis
MTPQSHTDETDALERGAKLLTPFDHGPSEAVLQLHAMESRLSALTQEVDLLRTEVNHLKAAVAPPMSWKYWFRHQIKMALGLDIQLGRLKFPTLPHPIRIPARYYRKPVLDNPPLISVVTPSYKQGPFLERTIRSVLDQEYPRLQYVVQDGGSKDETGSILERYRNRLHHCESRPDKGQSHAINLGFAHTSGEIMAYLNSDDLLLPGALHAVAAYFIKHPEVDVVYGHRVVIDQNDDETGRWVLPSHDDEVLRWADFVPQETLFWRRRLWDKVGVIDESFRFAMDWDLLLRFQDAGAKFHRLGRFLGGFRVHTTSKTITVVNSLGNEEMARLRRRCHGRDVTPEEIHHHLRAYLRKHILCNRLYRLGIFRY